MQSAYVKTVLLFGVSTNLKFLEAQNFWQLRYYIVLAHLCHQTKCFVFSLNWFTLSNSVSLQMEMILISHTLLYLETLWSHSIMPIKKIERSLQILFGSRVRNRITHDPNLFLTTFTTARKSIKPTSRIIKWWFWLFKLKLLQIIKYSNNYH